MIGRNTHMHRTARLRVLHAVVIVIAMMSFDLNSALARASALKAPEYRVATANNKFDGTWQFAAAYKMRPPPRLRVRHLEMVIGTVSTSSESRLFISMGPVWRLPLASERLFIDVGASPTLITGSVLNGRDLGGNFHFTSSAEIGATFGSRDAFAAALRIQHTSNGGLSSRNPGLDMVGLSFTFVFDH